ncbi:MAG: peptidylprolyl isomerase [Deltaproteobacteria bacterium]
MTSRAVRSTLTSSASLTFLALVAPACFRPSSAPPAASVGNTTLAAAVAAPAVVPDADGAVASSAPTAVSPGTQRVPDRGTAPPPQRVPHPEAANEPVQDEPQNVAVVPAHPEPTRPDPMHGRFTLAQATAGLPEGNDLVADISTSMGTFTCALLQTEAPVTVASFVGLARGLRDFWDPTSGRWTRLPFFDGSVFHRVIPEFMVQGGDILRSGRGGPGFVIPDENVADHGAAGLLCMANRGPNTGGGQFFITEIPLPRLNGSYSVFGRCTPTDLVQRMARVPRSRRDQPISPVYIQHVEVHR